MEYNHSGVGTIVQSTWWVQCTHVHVVYGYVNRKVIEILMGITAVDWMGVEGRRRRGGGGG